MRIVSKFFLTLGLFSAFIGASAQDTKTVNPFLLDENKDGYNDLSVHPIHKSDNFYQVDVWRRVDFREKANRSFFAKNQELVKFIIEAVKAGKLTPYATDSLITPMSMEDFNKKITIELDPALNQGAAEEDDFFVSGATTNVATSEDRLADEFYIMEIKEYMIYDKHRSRMYPDIQSLAFFYLDINQFQQPLGYFRYVDLVKLFDEMPQVIWYNPQNRAADKKISDAFDLRLFQSRIIKMSNAADKYVIDIYGDGKNGLVASQNLEYKLLDKEAEMWEY